MPAQRPREGLTWLVGDSAFGNGWLGTHHARSSPPTPTSTFNSGACARRGAAQRSTRPCARAAASLTRPPTCKPCSEPLLPLPQLAMATKLVKLSTIGLAFAGWSCVFAGQAILQVSAWRRRQTSGLLLRLGRPRARAAIGRDCGCRRGSKAAARAPAATHWRIGHRGAHLATAASGRPSFDFVQLV